MKKSYAAIALAVVALITIAGVVVVSNRKDTSTAHNDMTNMTENPVQTKKSSNEALETTSVEIKDFAFLPAKIKVKKGATVTWTNNDSAKHDVSPDNKSADFVDSELLAKGESYRFTFNTVGIYAYHCSPHPYMKASVEVIE